MLVIQIVSCYWIQNWQTLQKIYSLIIADHIKKTPTTQMLIVFNNSGGCHHSPACAPMALYTLLHTCSRSSTLSMGEWLLCIRLSFFFALSTPWASKTATRTPRRCSAPSWQACRLLVNLWRVPSCVWSESSTWPSWTFSGFSTQPNTAFSKASSASGEGGGGGFK